jgi:hypothetical protein
MHHWGEGAHRLLAAVSQPQKHLLQDPHQSRPGCECQYGMFDFSRDAGFWYHLKIVKSIIGRVTIVDDAAIISILYSLSLCSLFG